RANATGTRRNGGSFHAPRQTAVRQAQPQCAPTTLSVLVSHRKLALRSKSEGGRWTMALFQGNVARSLHPRRLCDRGRIQDDRSVRKADCARFESARV